MRWNTLALLVMGVLLVGAALVQTRPLAANGPTLRLIAPNGALSGSQPFDVQVQAEGVTDLAAFEFDVVYDANVISLTDITVNSFLGASSGCNADAQRCAAPLGPLAVSNGRKSVGGYTYGTGAGASGTGIVATLRFAPVASGTTSISLANPLVTNTQATPSTPTTQGDTVTIGQAAYRLYLPLLGRSSSN